MKKFLKENSLSIVLFSLFIVFLIGLSLTGYAKTNAELDTHQQPTTGFSAYLMSGDFIEAVFENWESEFLQMGALVVLTIWLVQKGSADSKKLTGKNDVDTSSRYSIIRASSGKSRRKAVGEMLYANSLSIVLFSLFFMSFILHAWSGTSAANQQALLQGESQMSVMEYATSSQFWFESFQNWQSEFLSVAVLIVLSVFLRQWRSPESKPVGAPDSRTGS